MSDISVGPLLLQLLKNEGPEINIKDEKCVMNAQGMGACNTSEPKKMGVRGYVPAWVRIQKVIPATAFISQAKNPGPDKHKAEYQYPR